MNCSYNAAGKFTCSKRNIIEHFALIPDSKLNVDQMLRPGDYIFSKDGKFILIYQPDGNLVLYPKAVWSANVFSKDPGYAIMQGDGNFVIYDKFNKPYWATMTVSPSSGPFQLQLNDSTLSIVDKDNSTIWKNQTPMYIRTRIETINKDGTKIGINEKHFEPLMTKMEPGERFRFIQSGGNNSSSYYTIVNVSKSMIGDMYIITLTPQIQISEIPRLKIDTYVLFDS